MIYTVTFNPALDYVLRVGSFLPGQTNRAEEEELQVGGKGVNVSLILRQLGVESVALGFLAGYTGSILRQWLEDSGVRADFVTLPAGMTRINVKLKSGVETEINGRGPDIHAAALDALFHKLDALRPGDTLVLAGSIPASLPPDIYERVLARLEGREIRFVVDATGKLLENVLPFHPFLIKPNHHELGELVGKTLDPHDPQALVEAAQTLQKKGAGNVLVSLAGDGAVLITQEGRLLTQAAAQGTLKNSVGSGDSMVAGFLAGYDRGGYEEALRLGTAAGGATAFSPRLATREEIDNVYQQIVAKKG